MEKYFEIGINDIRYPEKLRSIENPPNILYCLGDISLLNTKCISVVGSRKATTYGKEVSYLISKEAKRNNITIVSGFAKGIDSFSHESILSYGGKTIAVFGCGVDYIYPKENSLLYEEIKENGLIISEYPIGTKPTKYTFPKRNRIISGLSECVVVVEALSNSGSILTSEIALEQGREVFSIPGSIFSPYSLGTNKLIYDGARIVYRISDIFTSIGIDNKFSLNSLSNLEKRIIEIVNIKGEISVKELKTYLQIDENIVKENIASLEINGYINYELGKIYIAKF